jgi:hypothetical protein
MSETTNIAAVHPVEFWTDYQPGPDGQQTAHDWVRWIKKGVSNGATTEDKVARVKKHDPAVWDVLGRHYDAWKRGQDAPVDGTPLDAAPFMSREMVKVLGQYHIRSVEDLANAEDAGLAKLNVPGIRATRDKARAYLDAQANVAGVAAELAAMRERMAALEAERDEAVQTADTMAAAAGRPRRGRPPSVSAEAMAG